MDENKVQQSQLESARAVASLKERVSEDRIG